MTGDGRFTELQFPVGGLGNALTQRHFARHNAKSFEGVSIVDNKIGVGEVEAKGAVIDQEVALNAIQFIAQVCAS